MFRALGQVRPFLNHLIFVFVGLSMWAFSAGIWKGGAPVGTMVTAKMIRKESKHFSPGKSPFPTWEGLEAARSR